jgi:hypothetical protein
MTLDNLLRRQREQSNASKEATLKRLQELEQFAPKEAQPDINPVRPQTREKTPDNQTGDNQPNDIGA